MEADWERELGDPDVPQPVPPLGSREHLYKTDAFVESGLAFCAAIQALATTLTNELDLEARYVLPKPRKVLFTGAFAIVVNQRNKLCSGVARDTSEVCVGAIEPAVRFAQEISHLLDECDVNAPRNLRIADAVGRTRLGAKALALLAPAAYEELDALIRHYAPVVIDSSLLPTFDMGVLRSRASFSEHVTDLLEQHNELVGRLAEKYTFDFQVPPQMLERAKTRLKRIWGALELDDEWGIKSSVARSITRIESLSLTPQAIVVDTRLGVTYVWDSGTGVLLWMGTEEPLAVINEFKTHHNLTAGCDISVTGDQGLMPSMRRPRQRRREQRLREREAAADGIRTGLSDIRRQAAHIGEVAGQMVAGETLSEVRDVLREVAHLDEFVASSGLDHALTRDGSFVAEPARATEREPETHGARRRRRRR